MPKIEIYQKSLFSFLGKEYSDAQLEEILPAAKAELDETVNDEGLMKIELNDTNRPDLWSAAGLGRLLRLYEGGSKPQYNFFSSSEKKQPTNGEKIVVDKNLKNIRPYIAGFIATGKTVDEETLKDLIQTQEKLCWNYGQKRKSIAMGIYRSDIIQFPVQYKAVDPRSTRFQALGMDSEENLVSILENHEKGQEYGSIVKDFELYPYLTDNNGDVLSFPPIINSARIGAVEVGDNNLFVELTGLDLKTLTLAANIVATEMADAGFTIKPIEIEYPYETEWGTTLTMPYYFQEPQNVTQEEVNKLLGEEFTVQDISSALKRLGNEVETKDDLITVYPAEYRNDFLHAVDIIEDVMIGRGMDTFVPEMPQDFTVGRLSKEELLARKVKSTMVGLGFQEMIFNYLGSLKDNVLKMDPSFSEYKHQLEDQSFIDKLIANSNIVQVANPMSENFEFVRNSILPSLLESEAISANAVYPHRVFEVGKIVLVDSTENYGSKTINSLGFLEADNKIGFNEIYSQINTLLYYLSCEYSVREIEDKRFITGRVAQILKEEEVLGTFGELHPAVLENWGITVPCVAAEINLDILVK